MSEDTGTPWPTSIRVKRQERRLEVDFDDGASFALPAELLRVESPSAEVQGHGEGKTIVAGKQQVGIADLEMVGNYAVRIHFDDGHDTGLYTWSYLHKLGRGQETVWQRYLQALEERGLSRAP
tara:strand:- start:498 stop:866 length:369 start_codon:yes stop_codon:yes gene_type:complete